MIISKNEAVALFPLLLEKDIEFSHSIIDKQVHIKLHNLKDASTVEQLISSPTVKLKLHSTSLILDMCYSELQCVDEDYGIADQEPNIAWLIENSSFEYKDNDNRTGQNNGLCDFIFNLGMLDSMIEDSDYPHELVKELEEIRDAGFTYILFNQGC